jgi:uncharacterized protein (TIGR03067 family)
MSRRIVINSLLCGLSCLSLVSALAACEGRRHLEKALHRCDVVGDGRSEKLEDQDALLGDWVVVSFQIYGISYDDIVSGAIVTIRTNLMAVKDEKVLKGITGYKLMPKDKPPSIDLIEKGDRVLKGIYSIDGKTLTLCLAEKYGAERPTKFESNDKTRWTLLVLKRKE